MTKLYIWLILLLPLPTLASQCKEISQLSIIQKHTLHKMYQMGEADNLGYTLAALALVESSAGKFRLNVRTNDLGVLQINATTAQNTLKIEGHYNQLALHQELVYNDRLSAEIALATLHHFRAGRDMNRKVWSEMIKSYNEGYKWRRDKLSRKKAEKYLTKVSQSVKLIKHCEEYWR